jgi:hypothetical protein
MHYFGFFLHSTVLTSMSNLAAGRAWSSSRMLVGAQIMEYQLFSLSSDALCSCDTA